MSDKEQIKKRFWRAASSYDDQAIIQRQVADHLLALLERAGCGQPSRILEIGCCTGLLSQRLAERYPGARELVLNDLVEEFRDGVLARVAGYPGQVTFVGGDGENLDVSESFDLIASSSTFHWFQDLSRFLGRIHQGLNPGGYLAFAMYGPENLREIRELTGVGLAYPSLAQVKAMLAENYFVQDCQEHQQVVHFADPRTLLEHLRKTGVNALSGPTWTRKRLQEFMRGCDLRFRDDEGVYLTYHPLYFIARPKRVRWFPPPVGRLLVNRDNA